MQDLNKISLNFILATARTGSTLLSSMLNAHPEVISTIEEPFAYTLFPKYKSITKWDDNIIEEFCHDFFLFSEGSLDFQFGKKEDLNNLLKTHRLNLTGEKAIKLAFFAFFPNKDKTNITTLVDKELIFHHYLNEIVSFYPTSKFIVLCRDPRDTILVKLKYDEKRNKRETIFFHSKVINYEYASLNEKLSKINPDRYIKIKYEDLVQNPEQILIKICSFLNITFNNKMLNYHEDVKKGIEIIGDNEKQQIINLHLGLTQKVNTDKINIWKTQLTQAENNIIWSICGKVALSNGYLQDNCKQVKYFKLNMLYDLCRFYIFSITIPTIYYYLPFRIKYLIKKIKYSKSLKKNE